MHIISLVLDKIDSFYYHNNSSNIQSRIDFPIPAIVLRIDECTRAKDAEGLLNYLSVLYDRIQIRLEFVKSCNEFYQSFGVDSFIRILKTMDSQEEIVILVIEILECLKFNTEITSDLIKNGSVEYLTNIIHLYQNHEYLPEVIAHLIKDMLATNARVVIMEIQREATYLKLCQSCQETIERELLYCKAIKDRVFTKPKDRLQRILTFMKNYSSRIDVQLPSLDAIISFSRNSKDHHGFLMDIPFIQIITSVLNEHISIHDIVWRVAIIFSQISKGHSDIASTLVIKYAIHEYFAYHFFSFGLWPIVQQQILWMFQSFLEWESVQRIVYASHICVTFFTKLILIKKELSDMPMITLDDKFKPVRYVIPVSIRKLYREFRQADDSSDESQPKVRLDSYYINIYKVYMFLIGDNC